MFATLFLGVVLAVFLTLGVVSGDAERGLLQPLVVRPIGRSTLLLLAFPRRRRPSAPRTCSSVYFAARRDRRTDRCTGGPPRSSGREPSWRVGVVIVIALSLLGSVVLSSTANGIAVFMLFGAGLVAGLLGTIGHALNSHADPARVDDRVVGAAVRGAVPGRPPPDHRATRPGLTSFLLQLGPFGGGYVHGWTIRVWAVAYLALVVAAALAAFARRDL